MSQRFYSLTTLAIVVAFIVIVLGAYTRLTNAGLGCPDWPGCYGHLTASSANLVPELNQKAWTEMIHRYAAFTLVIITTLLIGMAFWKRRHHNIPITIPILLACVILSQALLGKWTVTLGLHPLIVTAHLLGGFTVLSLLWTLRLQIQAKEQQRLMRSFYSNTYRRFALLGLLILIVQIALGAWVSTNYAGLACIGFPYCNGQLWPSLHLIDAYQALPFGINYEGGQLANPARITIQMIHRIGALITFTYLCFLGLFLFSRPIRTRLKMLSLFLIMLCITQVSLGIINVIYLLPLSTAVAHNAVAALLLLTMITLTYRLYTAKESSL